MTTGALGCNTMGLQGRHGQHTCRFVRVDKLLGGLTLDRRSEVSDMSDPLGEQSQSRFVCHDQLSLQAIKC